MGVHQQDLDTLFGIYRRAIEIAEATRQRAIAAALAEHCRALEDIEATYRRDVAEARRSYCQLRQHPLAYRQVHLNRSSTMPADRPFSVMRCSPELYDQVADRKRSAVH